MSSRCRDAVVGLLAATGVALAPALQASEAPDELRVCADPANLPYSSADESGFENRIARMLADELHARLRYAWEPQGRGFVRKTIGAGLCDVFIGVPAGFERVATTRPYYRSTYAFVSRHERALRVRSFDDPRLRTLTIGIQVTGDDYDNPPAAHALAARHLTDNVRGFPVYGDYSQPDPQRDLVDAVADGHIDLAVMWGPQAGYFARQERVALDVTPVDARPAGNLVFAFDIARGVRKSDEPLRASLDRALARHAATIRQILAAYGVPLS